MAPWAMEQAVEECRLLGHDRIGPEHQALREALQLDHDQIGTEHFLLALVAQRGGVANDALARMGAPPGRVREEVHRLLSAGEP